MLERRKYQRFDLKLPAQVKIHSGEQETPEVIEALTRDICAGGAYIEGLDTLPEGTRVSLDLVLKLDRLKQIEKNQARIQVKGRVIRHGEGSGLAICFDKRYRITPI